MRDVREEFYQFNRKVDAALRHMQEAPISQRNKEVILSFKNHLVLEIRGRRSPLFHLVTNFKLIIDRVHTRDVALLQKAYDFDKDLINHHYRYCLRVLNQIGCVDFQRTLIVHSCLSLYELLGDKLGDITKVLKRTSREASSKSLGLMLEILDLFINYMKPFKEYTISEVNAYLNAKFKIQNELVLLENDPESELKTEMYNLIVFMTHIAETHISKEWLR